jgi:hypothetical protein
VELELAVVATMEGEASLSLLLPFFELIGGKLSGSMEDNSVHKLSLTLIPEDDIFVSSTRELSLAMAINDVKRTLQDPIN